MRWALVSLSKYLEGVSHLSPSPLTVHIMVETLLIEKHSEKPPRAIVYFVG